MMEKTYRMAIRPRGSAVWGEERNYTFQEIRPAGARYWQADPFLIEQNGRTFLFFEAYDRIKRKGVISCCEVRQGEISAPRVVIEEAFHLSFPYVFSEGKEIFMMPETCEDNSILLYRAVQFPYQWEKYKKLKTDVFVCDSILLLDQQNRKKGIIASEMFRPAKEGTLQSCYVRNMLFPLEQGLNAADRQGAVLKEGDYGVRNAGALFFHDGKMIRAGQDCRDQKYGDGIVFWEIESIHPYVEKEIRHISKEEISQHLERSGTENLLGSHTYNQSDHYEVIDFSYLERIPFYIQGARLGLKIARRLKRELIQLMGLLSGKQKGIQ